MNSYTTNCHENDLYMMQIWWWFLNLHFSMRIKNPFFFFLAYKFVHDLTTDYLSRSSLGRSSTWSWVPVIHKYSSHSCLQQEGFSPISSLLLTLTHVFKTKLSHREIKRSSLKVIWISSLHIILRITLSNCLLHYILWFIFIP